MGRFDVWFSKQMRPVSCYFCENIPYRVLPYLHEFLFAPSSTGWEFTVAYLALDYHNTGNFLRNVGIVGNPERECWNGTTRLKNIGLDIDSSAMKALVTNEKVEKTRKKAQTFLVVATRNACLVLLTMFRYFCAVRVSLSLGFALSRFKIQSLWLDMEAAELKETLKILQRAPESGEKLSPFWAPAAAVRLLGPYLSPVVTRQALLELFVTWGRSKYKDASAASDHKFRRRGCRLWRDFGNWCNTGSSSLIWGDVSGIRKRGKSR